MDVFTFLGRLCALSMIYALCACVPPPEDGGTQQQRPAEEQAPRPDLVEASSDVRTIQLYRGSDERSLPVLPLGSGDQLTLTFDKLQSSGRPLSVYFYQMNAQWERAATPNDYMQSFPSDNILNYQRSQGTEVNYVHYEYSFPNDQIGFRIGGNYLVRVTEQGNERDVLFEKPFYVTENRGQAGMNIESVMMGGVQSPSQRPVVQFRPRDGQMETLQNYHACVLRDGNQEDVRCTRRARVASYPNVRFEIDRENAFRPAPAVHQLDLSRIQAGSQIDGVDRQARPTQVRLRPDYLQFRRDIFRQPLYGHSVINAAVPFLNNPGIQAEYVSVRFALASVSPETRTRLTGSFNASSREGAELTWSTERDQFETEMLVKQGWHEYHYERTRIPDEVQDTRAERERPSQHRYTALVYVRDIQLNTDRIIAASSVIR